MKTMLRKKKFVNLVKNAPYVFEYNVLYIRGSEDKVINLTKQVRYMIGEEFTISGSEIFFKKQIPASKLFIVTCLGVKIDFSTVKKLEMGSYHFEIRLEVKEKMNLNSITSSFEVVSFNNSLKPSMQLDNIERQNNVLTKNNVENLGQLTKKNIDIENHLRKIQKSMSVILRSTMQGRFDYL